MSFASVWGFALVGIDAVPVRVEAHARPGLPGVSIVGLPGAAVREAKERVRSGAACCGFPLPARRITINLSPGDVPKEGPGFDLPVALATLAACGHLSAETLGNVGALGEVSLDGMVRPTRGVLSACESARALGLELLVVPVEGLAACAAVGSVPAVGVRSLAEAVAALRDPGAAARLRERGKRWLGLRRQAGPRGPGADVGDMAEVAGHRHAKRALEIAAAGGHHLLMVGSPGAGKTMLARRLAGILPPLSQAETLEVSRIWGAAGLSHGDCSLVTERPFRAPHHTASRAALVGGGAVLRPGEVSLAHRGVLFLDELPEFSRDVLEALRQPLEEGRLVISRRSGTSQFPAACTLVAAMNPCPCGFLGHPESPCRCSAAAVERYRDRISGPLLDRIDILIEVPPLHLDSWEDRCVGETSAEIRSRVIAARAFRDQRTRGGRGVETFARAGGGSLREDGPAQTLSAASRGPMTREAWSLLGEAFRKEGLSGRGYVRVMALARTIADIDLQEMVGVDHVAEALSLRLDYRRLGVL